MPTLDKDYWKVANFKFGQETVGKLPTSSFQVYIQTKCKESDGMEEKSEESSKQKEEREHSELKVTDRGN